MKRCGVCGVRIKPTTRGGETRIDDDPKSAAVEQRLMEYIDALGTDEQPPTTRHPLCSLCFIGWLHTWLDVR